MILIPKFLNLITVAERKRVNEKNSTAQRYFTFQTAQGGIINTQERFFQAANHSLPLNPPGTFSIWDALDDSLFGGLLDLRCSSVEIVWPFADDVAASATGLLIKGIKLFQRLAENLSDESEPGRNITLKLYLVCANEASKRAVEAKLGSFT